MVLVNLIFNPFLTLTLLICIKEQFYALQEFIYFLLLYPLVRVWINNGLSDEKYIPDEPETPTIVRPENKTFIKSSQKRDGYSPPSLVPDICVTPGLEPVAPTSYFPPCDFASSVPEIVE